MATCQTTLYKAFFYIKIDLIAIFALVLNICKTTLHNVLSNHNNLK